MEAMSERNERKEYWALPIAFDCPKTGKRHTINDCFLNCQENYYEYLPVAGKVAAFLCCFLDPQERFLHNGVAQRNP